MTKSKLRRSYGDLAARVRDILRRHDPIGLISMGAPADEYEPEVERILPALKGATNLQSTATLIHDVFVQMFSPADAGPVSIYEKAAADIWDAWLLFRVPQLTGTADVDLVTNASVEHDSHTLVPHRIVRVGDRYWVATVDEPQYWWMGKRTQDGVIHVWGQYGHLEEAFVQH